MGDVPIPLLPRKEDVKVESLDMPPGFRFHPTDLEIILNYLLEKAIDSSFTSIAIADVDINGCEPWDLPGRAKMGEKDWWFFWHRGRKYPTGTRTNRATEKGYWKATGKDKEIFKGKGCLVGMKKTLVFYLGRAPKGGKTNWVMHEYRLEGKSPHNNNISSSRSSNSKNDWVVCRVFHKNEPKKEMELGDDGNWRISLKTSSFDADHRNSNYSDSSALPPLSDFPLYTLNSVPSSDPSHENNRFIQTTNPTYPPITPLFKDIPTTNPDSETYPGSLHFHPAAQHLSYLHLPDAQMFQMTLDPFKSTCKMENQQQPPSCSRDTGPTVDNGSSWDDAGSPSVGPLVDLEDFMWK